VHKPSDGLALFASALALEDTGQWDAALARYDRTLAADSGFEDALHNRGLLLAKLGRLDEAERSHREYVASHDASARAHFDLADVLLAKGKYEDALARAETALRLDAGFFRAAFVAGLAAAMLMRFESSANWLRRARKMDSAAFDTFLARQVPDGALDRDLDPRAIHLLRNFDAVDRCDWTQRDEYVAAFGRLIEEGESSGRPVASPPLAFRSLALAIPLAARRTLADHIGQRLAIEAAPLRSEPTPRGNGPLRGRLRGRLRVAYLSPDFRTHPTGILAAPLFRLHDRSRFEVFAFSLSPADGSPWRLAAETGADHFEDYSGLPVATAAARIRAAGIDVLVDLAGLTTGAQPELVAAGLATVRVSYLGYPGSCGHGQVDYLICDRVCAPPQEEIGYGEALARLPRTFWICDPQAPPAAAPSRAELGIASGAFLLYALHPAYKIEPEVFACWMRILREIPRAALWLLDDAPQVRNNLCREAVAQGIATDRLVFASRVPYAEYRARIGLADLALDTRTYNGGATTLDCIAAGVPVLTCPAPGMAGRMAASALLAADLPDLVFADLDAYARSAIALAADPNARSALAGRVRKAGRAAALFDIASRVREVEAAYMHMHERALRGEKPASFDL